MSSSTETGSKTARINYHPGQPHLDEGGVHDLPPASIGANIVEIAEIIIHQARTSKKRRADPSIIRGGMRGPPETQPIRVVSTKRGRDEDDVPPAWAGQFIEEKTTYIDIGGLGGFKIPKHLESHAVLYPEPYVMRIIAGSSASSVANEWKIEVHEWLTARDVTLRRPVAKTELDGVKKLFADFLALAVLMLRKWDFEALPDVFWKTGHHILEPLIKIVSFHTRGEEGVELQRTKMESLWAKGKIDYSSVLEAVAVIKPRQPYIGQQQQNSQQTSEHFSRGQTRRKN